MRDGIGVKAGIAGIALANDAAFARNLFTTLFLIALACTGGLEADAQTTPGRPVIPAVLKVHDLSYGTIEAPDDFTLTHTGTIDSFMGTLTRKSDGFKIHFDVGLMAGTRVSWMIQDKFALFRLHVVSGNFAYTGIERAAGKQTVATTICDWCERSRRFLEESEAIRALPPEQREEKYRDLNNRRAQVTQRGNAANFWADFKRDEDLADFMLIVNSYKPK
jgi:hypothetical protein